MQPKALPEGFFPSDGVRAMAHPNIALIKYWGKEPADPTLNRPAVPSLSVTLGELCTQLHLQPIADGNEDKLFVDGVQDTGARCQRMQTFLTMVRAAWLHTGKYEVRAWSNFPVAAGLASSASFFAALACGAFCAMHKDADAAICDVDGKNTEHAQMLSRWARRGSGSAARSLFGGFVGMDQGVRSDGEDAQAYPIAPSTHWPLSVVVAVMASGAKKVGSTEGMERSRTTSPFYPTFVGLADEDMRKAKAAVLAKDFAVLADVSEQSMLKMHAVMLASWPPLIYWQGCTLSAMQALMAHRAQHPELPGFLTIDAGPQLKWICPTDVAPQWQAFLQGLDGVQEVWHLPLGQGAKAWRSEG